MISGVWGVFLQSSCMFGMIVKTPKIRTEGICFKGHHVIHSLQTIWKIKMKIPLKKAKIINCKSVKTIKWLKSLKLWVHKANLVKTHLIQMLYFIFKDSNRKFKITLNHQLKRNYKLVIQFCYKWLRTCWLSHLKAEFQQKIVSKTASLTR